MKKITVGSYTVFLDGGLTKILHSFRQVEKNALESGGILLGQIESGDVYLLRASIPNPQDKSFRAGFIRNKEAAQLIIDHEFINSGKKTIYLGEWHTHPEDTPNPSFQDVKMIKKQFKKNDLNEEFVLLVIVGNKSLFIGVFDNDELHDLTILWSQLK